MSGITVIEKEPFEQSWALKIAVGVYILFLLVYACWFRFQISDSVGTWGQFGDYVGGAINPIVGLITIWLLTASLKQSREEMTLTRKALEDAEKSQKATEAALRDQIEVTQKARDVNNAVALFELLNAQFVNLQSNIRVIELTPNHDKNEVAEMKTTKAEVEKRRANLSVILEKELNRLSDIYVNN